MGVVGGRRSWRQCCVAWRLEWGQKARVFATHVREVFNVFNSAQVVMFKWAVRVAYSGSLGADGPPGRVRSFDLGPEQLRQMGPM